MNKKSIIGIILAFITLGSILGMTTYHYYDLNRKSELDYNLLSGKYNSLQNNYTELHIKYIKLDSQYSILFSNYNTLIEAFNNPLPYKEIPSESELKSWLAIDETNQLNYTMPNFVCGDFAVMLSQHAKLKYWDMGVDVVWGYNWDTKESFAHAFNAIICEDGIWYIEPQTDYAWYYYYEGYTTHIPISSGGIWWFPNGNIYVEQYSKILWY